MWLLPATVFSPRGATWLWTALVLLVYLLLAVSTIPLLQHLRLLPTKAEAVVAIGWDLLAEPWNGCRVGSSFERGALYDLYSMTKLAPMSWYMFLRCQVRSCLFVSYWLFCYNHCVLGQSSLRNNLQIWCAQPRSRLQDAGFDTWSCPTLSNSVLVKGGSTWHWFSSVNAWCLKAEVLYYSHVLSAYSGNLAPSSILIGSEAGIFLFWLCLHSNQISSLAYRLFSVELSDFVSFIWQC